MGSHLHLHGAGVAAVLGGKAGEEGEVGGRVVVGLILPGWILLVWQYLTTTSSSVAKVGPCVREKFDCIPHVNYIVNYIVIFGVYLMCASKGCQWSMGRRRRKGGMVGLDYLEPWMSMSISMSMNMSMVGLLEKQLT